MIACGKLGELTERDVHPDPFARDQQGRRYDYLVFYIVDLFDGDDLARPLDHRIHESRILARLPAAVDTVGPVIDQFQPELGRRRKLP